MAQAAPAPHRTHSFAKKTFHKPTYCHHCSDLLWGLIGQGYGCEGTPRMRSTVRRYRTTAAGTTSAARYATQAGARAPRPDPTRRGGRAGPSARLAAPPRALHVHRPPTAPRPRAACRVPPSPRERASALVLDISRTARVDRLRGWSQPSSEASLRRAARRAGRRPLRLVHSRSAESQSVSMAVRVNIREHIDRSVL